MAANLSFCRTLVDEWRRAGVTDAVLSPGSRSTPLAVALAEVLCTQVILDERSAAYTALGIGLASGRPALLVCTSGTAATHFHGAVIEADQAGVPLIVCTADRPPELQGVGAPQTTDQTHLYGRAVRWFAEPGPPDTATATTWRSLASRAVGEATGRRPGPVHLNLAFREPLLDESNEPGPAGRADDRPWHRTPGVVPVAPAGDGLAAICAGASRPLLVTGHGAPAGITVDGVPTLSDHRGPYPGTVPHWDLLVREPEFRAAHGPDLVVRAGMPPASKALAQWLATLDVPQIAVPPAGSWIDPSHVATWMLRTPTALALRGEPGWAMRWSNAGATAADAIDAVLDGQDRVSEPAVARTVLASRCPGSTVVASSSMPIRDLETFGAPRGDVRVLANRGVNGIDGVTSTAVGVALTGAPTTLVIGDLALLHDQGALTGLKDQDVDLQIIVVDNQGGGIFSFLSQADELDHDRFESLFGTPQPIDPARLLAAHDITSTRITTQGELDAALGEIANHHGVRAVVVGTDRDENRRIHDELTAAAAVALGS